MQLAFNKFTVRLQKLTINFYKNWLIRDVWSYCAMWTSLQLIRPCCELTTCCSFTSKCNITSLPVQLTDMSADELRRRSQLHIGHVIKINNKRPHSPTSNIQLKAFPHLKCPKDAEDRGAAGMSNLGLNLRDIILSTEAIQTRRFIINSAEQIQNNIVSLWRNSRY